mmetsp:Transcript_33759/g.100258  ORF Transcript_33759/g.100258 Transcript_33759/m.100258 type:complete len:228 (+) Transcript_33759:626-1309(+)
MWPRRRLWRRGQVAHGWLDGQWGESQSRQPEAALLRLLPQRDHLPPRGQLRLRTLARGGDDTTLLEGGGGARVHGPDRDLLHGEVQDAVVPDRRAARLAVVHLRAHLPGRAAEAVHRLRAAAVPLLEQEGHSGRLLAALPPGPAMPICARRQGAALPPEVLQDGGLPRPPGQGLPAAASLRLPPQQEGAPPRCTRRRRLQQPPPQGGNPRRVGLALPRATLLPGRHR